MDNAFSSERDISVVSYMLKNSHVTLIKDIILVPEWHFLVQSRSAQCLPVDAHN